MNDPHASPAPQPATHRRPYATPRLTVYGTVAALTASTATDGLTISRLTGG